MSDKRNKTNLEPVHLPDGQNRSSSVTRCADAVERVGGIAFPWFARALTLALAVIAGAAALSVAIAAGETHTEFIQTIGNDTLAEMRSSASLDQKEAYFLQMLR